MVKEELALRMNDTGLHSETLDCVLKTLLNTSNINVRRLTLPTDRIIYNSYKISATDDNLISHEVIIFKTIVKKINQLGLEKFKKYGLNNDNYVKLASLTDEEIFEWLKKSTIPKGDRSIVDILIKITSMCLVADMYGSKRIDLFEEKEQETPYRHKNKLPEKYTKRIYLNLPLNNVAVEFLTLYKIKCIEKGIPSKMKGMGSSGYDDGDLDTTILYSNDYYLMDHVNILEEIIKERPDLINNFGSPVISGARVMSENGDCYYTVSSGLLADETSNTYYDKLYKISFAFLCSQYLNTENKLDIPSLCSIKNSELNEYINRLLSSLDQKTKVQIVDDGHYQQIVCQVSSYLRFGDFDHLEVPLYQDSIFANYIKNDEREITIKQDEKEQYLYHTEDLISNVLDLYQQGDVSFNQLMENYLKRMTDIYKIYRYYALREPGFVMSDRNKEITAIFAQLLNGYELPGKMEGIEKQEYYQSIQSGINDYLNNKGKKI